MRRKMLTKAQVVAHCREVFKKHPDAFKGDIPAKREYFNNYTDLLCKDGDITMKQYESWTNPF